MGRTAALSLRGPGWEDDTRRQSQEGGPLTGFTSTRKGEILLGREDSVPTKYGYATPTY